MKEQLSAYDSPWTFRERVAMLAWEYCWAVFCLWTPKPFNRWRLAWLRLFGAQIHGYPFVHQRARIAIPWHLILHDRATVGDRANLYTLTTIELGERTIVAQEAYLCTGTHDMQDPRLPLKVARIEIGADCFIGARAFILPGVTVGARTVVAACSVVTRDIEANQVVGGFPRVASPRHPHPRRYEPHHPGASLQTRS